MSLKLRLAFFNTIFVLIALALGFFFLVSQTRRVFLDSIDHDLLFRGQMFSRNPGIRGPGGPGSRGGQPRQAGLGGDGGQGGQAGQPGQEGAGGDLNPSGPDDGQPPTRQPQGGKPGNGQGFDTAPPNDDIGRPVRYGPLGRALDTRETRVLDPGALAKRDTKKPILDTVLVEGVSTRAITVPMQGDLPAGFVQFGHDLQDFERLKQTQLTTILLLSPFCLVIAALVGWFLAGKAVKPINDVAVASEKISGSDMSTRLPVKGDDEIGRLSTAFNGMVDRLQLSFNERQRLLDDLKVALEKQRQFVGDASHELRTPLARIRITTSSVLEQESSPDEMKEALEIADRETVHMSNLVDQLLTLARLDSGQLPSLARVNLSDIAKEALAKFPQNGANPIQLELENEMFIMGDTDGLIRAVINLIENAKRYADDKEIVLKTRRLHGECILSVCDHGVGIDSQHLGRLTERFYRVDDARNRKVGGTGLGLAIVKSIVESSQGQLQIQSKPGEGTNVELIFKSI